MSAELIVVPAIRTSNYSGGVCVLTRKFIDGLVQFCSYWPGSVTVLIKTSDSVDDNLDHLEVSLSEIPFCVELFPGSRQNLVDRLSKAVVVLATLSDEYLHLLKDCKVAQVSLVWVAELSLNTRCQIIDAEVRNPLRRLKRKLREGLLELKYRRAIGQAVGIQCNGTPVYQAYRHHNRRPFLYFDSRVCISDIADASHLDAKIKSITECSPLRLAFSGRLIAIKGVDYLPRVATELMKQGISFSMDIFGGGELEPSLRRSIEQLGLHGNVRLRGVLDFGSELIPTMRDEVDLFVCCHPQGDPACTYLETLSCGTPIAGFGNEAWIGLAELCSAGWVTPLGDPIALASCIAMLDKDRHALAKAVINAKDFSIKHAFEETMRSRIDHLLLCAKAGVGV